MCTVYTGGFSVRTGGTKVCISGISAIGGDSELVVAGSRTAGIKVGGFGRFEGGIFAVFGRGGCRRYAHPYCSHSILAMLFTVDGGYSSIALEGKR